MTSPALSSDRVEWRFWIQGLCEVLAKVAVAVAVVFAFEVEVAVAVQVPVERAVSAMPGAGKGAASV
jgi:hypothetical protein